MMKQYGLNQFVGQLIGTVGSLVIICVSVVISFYYTNSQVLTNYNTVKEEENERNHLMRVEMLVSLSRQAEKSFYAEQNNEDAQRVLLNLKKAEEVLVAMGANKALEQNQEEQTILPKLKKQIQLYHSTFSESILLWRSRGFDRNTGVSLKLRDAAYDGLRSRLALYNTYGLQSIMNRIRWQEYEYYFYWSPTYLKQIHKLIADFRHDLIQSDLDADLTAQLEAGISGYERELNSLSGKKKNASHHDLEDQAQKIGAILEAHTIQEFSFLLRTLLYYEMEYRELGRQSKHVEGVQNTLALMSQRIREARISQAEKRSLFQAIDSYKSAFEQLVQLDNDISQKMSQTTQILQELTPMIDHAVSREEQVIALIRHQTGESNKLHTRINLGVMVVMVLLAIFLVSRMVRRLGRKVNRIGAALAQISQGDLEVKLHDIPQTKQDELDSIANNVKTVALSLKETMGRLHRRNGELEVISKKLAKYLSPQVYDSIFQGRQEVRIQSGRKKLTVFFSDIVGFTSTTDSMESEELTSLLNSYLNEMSKIALEHGGTIDKFIGDAIMIFFGDPDSRGEQKDAVACVRMAIKMRDRMVELRKIWRDEQGFSQPFRIRIGITTGFCTVGNFGSDDRMDYTIIGGNVNLASRLEHNAHPDTILISHETYSLVREQIACTAQEEIQVKGFAHPVITYRVDGIIDHKRLKPFKIETAGKGYALQVEADHLGSLERNNLAAKLEEIASKLRH
ncbi:MAG: hypothetical protein HQL67_00550 [Magnetococcales bacterium]|nr:hypothetical protein [Magnetococcales bacterium]